MQAFFLLLLLVILLPVLAILIRFKIDNVYIWLGSYVKQAMINVIVKKSNVFPKHIIFTLVDHFEPKRKQSGKYSPQELLDKWVDGYQKVASKYIDAEGKYPQHTHFYPIEEYEERYIDQLADLCKKGYGEIEVHYHHDNDTSENLTKTLTEYKNRLFKKGLLGRNKITGEIQYGFIHGNWSLDNSRRDGRWCGVNNELQVLVDTGCYADFTLPSASSETQTKKINSIYYAMDDPLKPKSHNTGVDLEVFKIKTGDLMIVQGPLTINWKNRKFGIFPRIENSGLYSGIVPIKDRVELWIKQRICVRGREDVIFVKIYTHGLNEKVIDPLLGQYMDQMHSCLRERYNDGRRYKLHYATAREMYNIIKAIEDGRKGDPNEYRDYLITPPSYKAT